MNLLTQIRSLFEPVLDANSRRTRRRCRIYLAAIKPAANAEHGDYQANCAMALAKALGQKPPDVAKAIVAKLPANDMLEPPTVAGPGFINLRLEAGLAGEGGSADRDRPEARRRAGREAADVRHRLQRARTSPSRCTSATSAARSSATPSTRLLRFLGHTVITDNHLGDWGTQFGMLLYGYKNFRDEAAYERRPGPRTGPAVRPRPQAVQEGRRRRGRGTGRRPDRSRRASEETAKLHAGDPENVALWKQFMPRCMEEIHAIYRRLGILPFDYEHGESFYNPMLAGVVEDLLAKGHRGREPGRGRHPEREGDHSAGPRRSRRRKSRRRSSASATGRSRTRPRDLATIKYRVEHLHPDAMLYVVGLPPGAALQDAVRPGPALGLRPRRTRRTSASARCSARTRSRSQPARAARRS